MTDQLEDIFAGLRAEALREIQAPGVRAARRTVRRRRATAAVATVGAVLLAIGGAATVVRMSTHRAIPAAQSPAELAEVAHAKLTAPEPLVDAAAPVDAAYAKHQPAHLGTLMLRVACAGAGRITLVVDGTPEKVTGETTPVEQTRLTVTCGADPVPASVTFARSPAVADFVVRLSDAHSAAGRAGFAYQIATS